jgi:putative transcriptional regulator
MNTGQAIWKITILTVVLVTAGMICPPPGMSVSSGYEPASVIPARLPDGPGNGGHGLQPAAGKLLIATERVRGSIFEDSVILLIEYSKREATGVIINRPTDVPLHALFPNLGTVRDLPHKVYLGGPVEPGKVIMLIKTPSPPEGAVHVLEDVFVSSSIKILERMGSNPAPDERLRLYIGYAGWGPRQLDTEILRGSWRVADATAELIFDTPPEKIKERLKRPHTMEVNASAIRTNVLTRLTQEFRGRGEKSGQLSKLNFDNYLINNIFLTVLPRFDLVIRY